MRQKLTPPSLVILCLTILALWNTFKALSLFRPSRTTCLSFKDRTAATDDRKPGLNTNYNVSVSSNLLKPRTLIYDHFSRIQIKHVTECRNRKLLVFKCGQRKCGGFGDRIKGIVSVFLVALLSNRSLVIDLSTPCELSDVFNPNLYNWDICLPYVRSLPQNETLDLDFGRVELHLWNFLHRDFDFDASWRKRVMFVFVDSFILRNIRGHKNSKTQLEWMQYKTSAEVAHRVIHTLFKPNYQIRQELEHLREVLNGRKLYCSHIRTDKDPAFHGKLILDGVNVSKVFSYLDRIDPKQYMIYVAADLDTVRTEALERFKAVIISRCDLVHIGLSKLNENQKCHGLYSTLLEWYVLSTCDSILISKSGFSCTAIYARVSSDNIYVYIRNGNKIVKTRLENLNYYCRMW